MLSLEYRDFNEAYYGVNRLILKKPEVLDYRNATMGGVNNVFITCKKTTCDKIDLGATGYKSGKWTHLVGTYLGPDKIEELKVLGEGVSGLSVGFDFLRKTTGNGACMLGIVLSREKRRAPWTRVTITWRTTELQRRWAADLILIHRMLELIPNTEFDEIDLYMVSAYQSAMYIIPLLEPVFKVDPEELDTEHPYTNMIVHRRKKYFLVDESPHKMLASGDRMVKLYKNYEEGIVPKSITVEDCIF